RRLTARSRSVLLVVACGAFLRALNVAVLVATLALPSKWLALPDRSSLATWSRCARLRPLLSAAPESLSWFKQTQRWLLTRYLALPDRKYRKALCKLGERLEATPGRLERVNTQTSRTDILMMIGTLGPGGAERQAVLTLKGIKALGHPSVALA